MGISSAACGLAWAPGGRPRQPTLSRKRRSPRGRGEKEGGKDHCDATDRHGRRCRGLEAPGLQAGAAPGPEWLLELCRVAVDHLYPGGRRYLVSPGDRQRRRGVDRPGLAAVLPVQPGGGADDGTAGVGVPDGGRAVSLGVDPGRPGLGLGHRLVQPGRPAHRPGRDQRRHLPVPGRQPRQRTRLQSR